MNTQAPIVANIACGDDRDTSGSMRNTLIEEFGTTHIFSVDEFGPIGVLLEDSGNIRHKALLERIKFATEHGANVISLAIHEECRAHPIDMGEATIQRVSAIEVIESYLSAQNIKTEQLRFLVWWQTKRIDEAKSAEDWCNALIYDSTEDVLL